MTKDSFKVRLVAAFDAFLKELQRANPTMSVTAIRVLIFLKTHPGGDPCWEPEANDLPSGPYVSELAESLGIPQATMTRIIKMLGEGDDRVGTGEALGLVTTMRDPKEHRRKAVCLTQKGSWLVENIFDAAEETLRRSPPRGNPSQSG